MVLCSDALAACSTMLKRILLISCLGLSAAQFCENGAVFATNGCCPESSACPDSCTQKVVSNNNGKVRCKCSHCEVAHSSEIESPIGGFCKFNTPFGDNGCCPETNNCPKSCDHKRVLKNNGVSQCQCTHCGGEGKDQIDDASDYNDGADNNKNKTTLTKCVGDCDFNEDGAHFTPQIGDEEQAQSEEEEDQNEDEDLLSTDGKLRESAQSEGHLVLIAGICLAVAGSALLVYTRSRVEQPRDAVDKYAATLASL